MAYRTFVVHDSSAARIGCGIVGNPTTAVATLTAHPDYSGGLSVDGTIAVTEMLRPSGGIYVFGTLTGLEASVTGAGIHIHSGVSCATRRKFSRVHCGGVCSRKHARILDHGGELGPIFYTR